jgi:hypothetical protein
MMGKVVLGTINLGTNQKNRILHNAKQSTNDDKAEYGKVFCLEEGNQTGKAQNRISTKPKKKYSNFEPRSFSNFPEKAKMLPQNLQNFK